MEMLTITEKSALLYEKDKFLSDPNPSRHHRLLLFFDINNAWYNLKSRVHHFSRKRYSSLAIGTVKKYLVTACIHLFSRTHVQLYSSILGFH